MMSTAANQYDGAFRNLITATPMYRVFMITASNNTVGAKWYNPEVDIETGSYYLVWVLRGESSGKKIKCDFGSEVQKITDKLDKEQ
jgi:hypothetical protein